MSNLDDDNPDDLYSDDLYSDIQLSAVPVSSKALESQDSEGSGMGSGGVEFLQGPEEDKKGGDKKEKTEEEKLMAALGTIQATVNEMTAVDYSKVMGELGVVDMVDMHGRHVTWFETPFETPLETPPSPPFAPLPFILTNLTLFAPPPLPAPPSPPRRSPSLGGQPKVQHHPIPRFRQPRDHPRDSLPLPPLCRDPHREDD